MAGGGGIKLPFGRKELQSVKVVLEQHDRTRASQEVFQPIANNHGQGHTDADKEHIPGGSPFQAGISHDHENQAQGYAKLDKITFGKTGEKDTGLKKPGMGAIMVDPEINGSIDEEKQPQVNERG